MNSFLTLFQQKENLISTTRLFLSMLDVKVTASSIQHQLESHPDYPSLLSLSDSLDKWHIENAALQIDQSQFHELETPFITSTTIDSGTEFVIIKNMDNGSVSIVHDNGVEKREDAKQFLSTWSGIVLIAEKNEKSGEPNYKKINSEENKNKFKHTFYAAIGFLTLVLIVSTWPSLYWQSITLLTSCIIGFVLCCFLFIIPVSSNENSSFRICHITGNSDCRKVLHSAASKVAGLSMSEAGLLFFAGNIIILLFNHRLFNGTGNNFLFWLTAISLPYTLFSVFYQWKVIQSWCLLCLGVQVILWINALLLYSLLNNQALNLPDIHSTFTFFISFVIISLSWILLKPAIISSQELKKWKRQHAQLKNNKDIFNTYLESQRKMPAFDGEITPIVLGNRLAPHTVTIISNPNCKPCADKHVQLNALLNQTSAIKAHVIFYACDKSNLTQIQLIKHIMALQSENLDVESALDNWYSHPSKNYEQWAKQFPVKDIESQSNQIDRHCYWCQTANVQYTPTVFIDGYLFSKYYELHEIADLIESLKLSEPILA